ncbi:DUF1738 domain-containing protein (plasmid) [Xanthomonas citri pv. citri]|nr:DUF1738 domain-containing protein [Xanthomonas citri pv. citri]
MRKDFRQRLTDALVQAIEENDGLPWQQGWDSMALRPFNPARGIKYKGGNVVNLLMEQIKRGSDDPRWMTLKQANEAGYSVRKGSKAAYVEYWDWGQQPTRKPEVDEHGKPLEPDEEPAQEEAVRRRPRVFYAAVFNGQDIVGLPELKREISWQPNELAEQLIEASGAQIKHVAVSRHGGALIENAAYYSHQYDKIVLPPRESFKSDGDYYATALHELAHWTGHHTRLDRRAPDEKRPFGSPEYAREELRAEIASAYLTAMLGVHGELHNHSKYTGHWLEVLKGDKHEIFRAARDAEEIVDHLFELAPELREAVEARMADNLLPKEPPRRKIGTGIIGELPNFIPADAPAPVRTGTDDLRWAAFEKTILDEADRFGVQRDAVKGALDLIVPQFSEIMDRAKANGFSAEEMNQMLGRSIVGEMKQADARQQVWKRFCDEVREIGKGTHPVERVEQALQQLSGHYQQVIVQSARESWPQERTNETLLGVLREATGGIPLTPEGVGKLVASAAPEAEDDVVLEPLAVRQKAEAEAEDDDDLVLQPLGISGELPEDTGATRDEPILMGDAQTTEVNEPS